MVDVFYDEIAPFFVMESLSMNESRRRYRR
jgi:hypothetical protein